MEVLEELPGVFLDGDHGLQYRPPARCPSAGGLVAKEVHFLIP